ncbi:MAG: PorP/SprF family type IX secretion system membrane protein [Chitinophagales bacterium]
MKKLLLTLNILLVLSVAFAQDFHFSQYWASPLNLNPALTGVIDDNIRFAANYRNQWFKYTTFATYAVSADANLFRNKLKGNFLGAGLGFYQDVEGEGEFKNTGVNLNLAYNQQFGGRKVKHYIGFGMQAAYYNKQINLQNLIYGNLFEINDNTDPIDFANYNNTSFVDFGAGINYFTNINKRHSVSAGFAISHIAQPNVSFGNNNEDILYRKYSANFSAKINLKNDVISIIPILLFQKQGPHAELDFGSYVKMMLNERKNFALYAGGQYRLSAYEANKFGSDAFILGIRAEYQSFDFGFAYDITTSDLRNAHNFMGGPELYLIYTIASSKSRYRENLNCPKF